MHLAPTNRIPRLFAALACFAVFAAIAALLVLQWPPILKLDESISKWPQQVAADNQSLGSFFKWLGTFTGTRAQTVYTVIIAVLLLIKKQHRAAIWTIAVMVTVGIAIPFPAGREHAQAGPHLAPLLDHEADEAIALREADQAPAARARLWITELPARVQTEDEQRLDLGKLAEKTP